MNNSIVELYRKAQELKAKEAELKAQIKAQRQVIAVEYQDNLSADDKAKQIAEAEKILTTAKQKRIELKNRFKAELQEIKSNEAIAKEIFRFVGYQQSYSLPKRKNSFAVEGSIIRFNREGIKEIAIDYTRADWQKTFKKELALQGINDIDRTADNIVYKASLLVKGNTAI